MNKEQTPKNLVIVGSGSTLLGSGLGKSIDSFDDVLRFHDQLSFIERHKEDVGTKTTILAANGNAKALRRLEGTLRQVFSSKKENSIRELIMVYSRAAIAVNKKRSRAALKRASAYNLPVKFWNNDSDTDSLIRSKTKRTGKAMRGLRPSSGFVVVYNMLNEYDKIYLCGFDYLAGKSSEDHFYMSRRAFTNGKWGGKTGVHDLLAESEVIKDLASQTGKISILKGEE